ncbi:hypothetical protein ACFVHR_04750 [Streptomyces sp. NPDC127168]|uniref:hypothetical protein n=1 Tax=unclassified Streptomyces TaxID=2593676 RepID=UPI0036320443
MPKFPFTARSNRNEYYGGEVTADSENEAVLKVEELMADKNYGVARTVRINGNAHWPNLTRQVVEHERQAEASKRTDR